MLLDRVGQLAAAPVFQSDHLATGIGDEALVAFQHGRNLFALIRVDQEDDLIVTHGHSLWISARSRKKAAPIASNGTLIERTTGAARESQPF
jgi:hypothetical protein